MIIGVNARLLLNQHMEGIPRYIYETTKQMALTHPEDKFILFFDRKIETDFKFPLNVSSVVVPWHARHPVLWYWWFEVMLPLYLRWKKVDVFYSGDGYLSKRSHVPTVMVMHDLAYLHYPQQIAASTLAYYKKNVPQFLSKADIVVAVSKYVKQDIVVQIGIPESKVLVAYNAVSSPEDVDQIVLPPYISKAIDDSKYFLYVGAIHPRKNIIQLIKGFEIFNRKMNSSYKLVIAGRMAWHTQDIKAAIERTPQVIYIGMVSESVKYKLIKNAVAMTYISVFEGFGIPLLEAMKMGTPVITSNVTSMPEVASDAALVVHPHSEYEISDAMSQLVEDDTLRLELITKGLSRYQDFSWQKSADIIYSALQKVSK